MATLTIRQLESRLRRAPHTVKEVYVSIPGHEGFFLIKGVTLMTIGGKIKKTHYVVIDVVSPKQVEVDKILKETQENA